MTNRPLRSLIAAAIALGAVGLASITPTATAAPPEFKSYIVTVAKGSERSVQARAKALGGEIGYVYDVALNGFSVRLPEAAAAALAKSPGVEFIEADGVVSIDATVTQSGATWGIDRIDESARALSGTYSYDSTGTDVRAYIIDTGIRASHVDFGTRVNQDLDYDFVSNDANADDCNGHGTHVAGTVGGTVYGVAKKVTLIGVRVLGCDGSGSWSGVIAGINHVASHAQALNGTAVEKKAVVVANMSLGGGASSSIDSAVQGAVNAGVVMVVAAGNSNRDACNFSPARAAAALTVGATTSSDARASYSNFGRCLDIFAPGTAITSTWYTGDSSTAVLSGTSMASPHVAGVAARWLQELSAAPETVAQIGSRITGSATLNVVTSAGNRSPNRLLFMSSSN